MTSAMLNLYVTPHDIEYNLYRGDQTYRRWGIYICVYMHYIKMRYSMMFKTRVHLDI